MIFWLCSYPRSGNTLTRSILKRCFNANTYTIYNPSRPGLLSDITGSASFDGTSQELIETARQSASPMFVKTHIFDAPDEDKVIYIVRDARAAMSSFRKFQMSHNNARFEIEEMVLGVRPVSSWAGHAIWALKRPPETTLILHYEGLTQPDSATIQQIADFTGLPAQNSFDITFEQLHVLKPEFFTTGTNGPGIAEIEAACPALFWLVNGEAMQRHGYKLHARALSRELCADAAQEMRAFAMRQRAQTLKARQKDKKPRPAERTNMRP